MGASPEYPLPALLAISATTVVDRDGPGRHVGVEREETTGAERGDWVHAGATPACKRGRKGKLSEDGGDMGRHVTLLMARLPAVEMGRKKGKVPCSKFIDEEMAAQDLIALLVLSIVAYLAGLTLFRALLHPLSNVPGPKLAAVTGWYEFYFDCVKHGQYAFHIQSLHKQYGKQICPSLRCSEHEANGSKVPLSASARGRSTSTTQPSSTSSTATTSWTKMPGSIVPLATMAPPSGPQNGSCTKPAVEPWPSSSRRPM